MKKLFLTLLAMASLGAANAQQKGSILGYGDLTFSTSKAQTGPSSTYATRNTFFGINPGIGYQFSHHSTVGLQGGFNVNRDMWTVPVGTVNVDLEDRTTTWGIGAFYRYTQTFGNVFFMFSQINAGYLSTTFATDSIGTVGTVSVGTAESKLNGFGASFIPGIGVNVYKGFALNFSSGGIVFTHMRGDLADAVNPRLTNFGFTFGRQFNIGVSRNINCGRKHRHGHMEPGMELRKHKKEKDDEDEDDE